MKQPIEKSVYATNKGGRILAPKNPAEGDPRASVIRTEGDLRIKSAKGRK